MKKDILFDIVDMFIDKVKNGLIFLDVFPQSDISILFTQEEWDIALDYYYSILGGKNPP